MKGKQDISYVILTVDIPLTLLTLQLLLTFAIIVSVLPEDALLPCQAIMLSLRQFP